MRGRGKAGSAATQDLLSLPCRRNDRGSVCVRHVVVPNDFGMIAFAVHFAEDAAPVIPTQTAWGLQAVVKDPDGRSVELTQR